MRSERGGSTTQRAEAGRLATIITRDFYEGRLDLSERGMTAAPWSEMPEVKCAAKLFGSGESPRTVRRFLTFIAALDRARDSNRLWLAGYELFRLHPDIFGPQRGSGVTHDRLLELLKASGVSQRHRPDTDAWHGVAHTLAREPDSAVSLVVERGLGDAKELLEDLKRPNRGGRARFPLLRGAKVGPVWIRIMVDPGRARISRLHLIPVGVDVQVRRATDNLGVTSTQGPLTHRVKRVIENAWQEAVAFTDIGGPEALCGTCAALDAVLWFFGKYGCSHCEKVGRRVPISEACDSCVW